MASMRRLLCILFCSGLTSLLAQEKIILSPTEPHATWDTLTVLKTELRSTLDSIKNSGFYTLQIDSTRSTSQRIFIQLGKKYLIETRIVDSAAYMQLQKSYRYKNPDSLAFVIQRFWAQKGYPFVSVKKEIVGFRDSILQLDLRTELRNQRQIDKYTVVGYPKLNRGFVKHGLGLKLGETYDETKITKISNLLKSNRLISESREPQSLFQKDTTTLFLYVEKQKANFFDGIVGFGNDENGDFRLNGNVLLQLRNNFNAMEEIRLQWQATPERNTNLHISARLPYLWGSPIGSETQIKILRQDSLFVNTTAQQRITYQVSPDAQIGLDFGIENSNFVQNDLPNLAAQFSDYNKTWVGASYRFLQPSPSQLQEENFRLDAFAALNRRSSNDQRTQQFDTQLATHKLWQLSSKHVLKTGIEAASLFSEEDNFLNNELYRIGGFGSLRGFNEQSIVANAYAIGTLEYRFVPNEGFYIAAFLDGGWIENAVNDLSSQLFGTGLGFSFITNVGVFNLSYAVGKFNNTPFDFNDSKVHFGILANF